MDNQIHSLPKNFDMVQLMDGNFKFYFDFLHNFLTYASINVSTIFSSFISIFKLLMCIYFQGPNYVHHVRFNAFLGKESFIHDICGGRKPNVCFWQAQEDGIYVRNNAAGTFKLMYKWDTINKLETSFQ